MLAHLKALTAQAPKPLVVSFALLFVLDLVLGLLTFQTSVIIRWTISWFLMYATLKGDKVWASVYAGLLFIGGVLVLLIFFNKALSFAVPFALVGWSLAAYILFAPSMNRFFTAKSALKQNVSKET